MKLTVYFDEGCKFWVGVVEHEENGRLNACRHIFGSEPKEAEILEFIHNEMMTLIASSTRTVESKLRQASPRLRRKPSSWSLKAGSRNGRR